MDHDNITTTTSCSLTDLLPQQEMEECVDPMGKANQANFDTSDSSFSSQALGVWNQLPVWIWEADSVLVFDTRLKTFLFDETSKQD